jgi:hypothetical protein
MDSKSAFRIGAALALASTALSTPLQLLGTERMTVNEIANLTWTVDRHVLSTWECVGQSCLIADTAGSTGRSPTMRAEGAKDADIKCIIAHNPPVGELLAKYSNQPPDVPKQKTGASSALMGGINSLWRPMVAAKGNKEAGTFKGQCTPNILIFAKGTLEPGEFGMLVGPPFTSKLPQGWSRHGVEYDADIPGDYCLGLPGGLVARDVINQAAAKCPNSKLFVSGYSQGAMVIRNGLARASPAAKARVKVHHSTVSYLNLTNAGRDHLWRSLQRGPDQRLQRPHRDILQARGRRVLGQLRAHGRAPLVPGRQGQQRDGCAREAGRDGQRRRRQQVLPPGRAAAAAVPGEVGRRDQGQRRQGAKGAGGYVGRGLGEGDFEDGESGVVAKRRFGNITKGLYWFALNKIHYLIILSSSGFLMTSSLLRSLKSFVGGAALYSHSLSSDRRRDGYLTDRAIILGLSNQPQAEGPNTDTEKERFTQKDRCFQCVLDNERPYFFYIYTIMSFAEKSAIERSIYVLLLSLLSGNC